MRDDLADVADRQAAGGEVDPDGVNRLFRSAHSLKALAGLFGFDPVGHLAHQLEDILDGLRLGRVAFDEASLGLIDDAVGVFASLLERVGDSTALEAMGDSIDRLSARIGTASPQPASDADPLADLDLDESLLRALTEYEEHRLRENIRRGRHIFVVEANFPILSFEEGLSGLGDALRAVGEVLSTLPAPGAAPDSQIRFSILGASEQAPGRDRRRIIDTPGASLSPVVRATAAAAPRPVEAADRPVSSAAEPSPSSLRSISETVRVDVGKLDDLMNRVGELVVERGAFDDLIAALRLHASTRSTGRGLRQGAQVTQPEAQGSAVGRARGAHGSAAPGVRQGLPRRSGSAPQPGPRCPPRDAGGRHRARQGDRGGAGGSA